MVIFLQFSHFIHKIYYGYTQTNLSRTVKHSSIPRGGQNTSESLCKAAPAFRVIGGCESKVEVSPLKKGSEGEGEGPIYTGVQESEKLFVLPPLIMPLR